MRHRLAALTAAALIGTLLLGPVAQSAHAQAQPQSPGLTLPAVTGTLARGGQFSGSLTITRLTIRAGQLVADGLVAGTVASESNASGAATPAPVSPAGAGSGIFVPTATSAPAGEIYAATATPASVPAATATLTATPTPAAPLGAVVTSTVASGEDFFPRSGLTEDRAYQSAPPVAISQSFRDIPLTLADPDIGACDTLHLDLGVVFVDQLGVQLDLAPAIIDLATLPRANRPLGGLLCTVASLLDLGPSSAQAAMLNELLPTVNRALSTASR